MPELPEVQAHAERLTEQFSGAVLTRFVPFNFTALKTAVPRPEDAYGSRLQRVHRRGKYLLLDFGDIHFVIHLMQGGRLLVDAQQSAKPRNGQARFVFAGEAMPALLLTEAGKERRAGVWCVRTADLDGPPLNRLGPDAIEATAVSLTEAFAATNMRVHGFLRDQHQIAGLGRMLANEVCHRAHLSPFAMTGKLGADGAAAVAAAIHAAIDDGLTYERTRTDMSSSADRPGRVHNRVGQACPECGDCIRSVSYSGYTVAYCPTCQTGGKVLADNTTSKFLK
ncbi:MAG TPA: DNA-formamidopyrimidine glycosylase family protein [Ilumatobacteraceae bacterium]|nr:DNA-formamidopyrimidine glycosylase family protein [Ilumatobacteraceae bacterium]